MTRPRPVAALLGTTVALAAADLGHKALATGEATLVHERGAAYVFLAAVALAWAGALLAVGSTALAVAGGILLGGAAGNLASLAFWPGVPNPLVAGGLAFTLADVFAAAGGLVLVPLAGGLVAWRSRAGLRDPVSLR